MAVRNPDNVLIGGYRVFIVENSGNTPTKHELGWMSGEAKIEEQANSLTVKESEGGTVLTLATDKEVHLTFSLLECSDEVLLMLNPSATATDNGFAVGTFQSDKTFTLEFWHKKRSGKYLGYRFFKAKISGNITMMQINPDNESPISIDIVGLADDTKDTQHNIYEKVECDAKDAPGGGW